jgi:hypothetical protein
MTQNVLGQEEWAKTTAKNGIAVLQQRNLVASQSIRPFVYRRFAASAEARTWACGVICWTVETGTRDAAKASTDTTTARGTVQSSASSYIQQHDSIFPRFIGTSFKPSHKPEEPSEALLSCQKYPKRSSSWFTFTSSFGFPVLAISKTAAKSCRDSKIKRAAAPLPMADPSQTPSTLE